MLHYINDMDRIIRGEVIEMLDRLEKMGCDIQRIRDRFMGNQEFYEKCFRKFVNQRQIEYLGEVLAVNDIQEAFVVAHTLKGTLSNLELTPLVPIIAAMVETLRRGSVEGVQEQYDGLLEEWQVFRDLAQ